jgi:twitching motility protein PilT
LVLSTLHTNSAPETIDRIVDVFPLHQQNQIRNQLASVLRIIVSQRLLPKLTTNERIPAVEILVNTPATASIIREGKSFLIDNILQTQESEGHILFEKYLSSLYRNGLISLETAYFYAIRPKELEKLLGK